VQVKRVTVWMLGGVSECAGGRRQPDSSSLYPLLVHCSLADLVGTVTADDIR
jgi:hypothetical protein